MKRKTTRKNVPRATESLIQLMLEAFGERRRREVLSNNSSLSNFDSTVKEIMDQCGPTLRRQYAFMTKAGAGVPAFARLETTPASNKWYTAKIQSGASGYGFSSVEAIRKELINQSGEVDGNLGIAMMLLPVPVTSSFDESVLFIILGDNAGQTCLVFVAQHGIRWSSLDTPGAAELVQSLLDVQPVVTENFFEEKAQQLVGELTETGAITENVNEAQTIITNFLKHEMRILGDQEVVTCTNIMEEVVVFVEAAEKKMKELLETATNERNAAHLSLVKKLNTNLSKAEVMAKGAQDRANRLDAEFRAYRKQHGRADTQPGAGGDRSELSIPFAVDKLFNL